MIKMTNKEVLEKFIEFIELRGDLSFLQIANMVGLCNLSVQSIAKGRKPRRTTMFKIRKFVDKYCKADKLTDIEKV